MKISRTMPRQASGFTLLEIIIALSLTAMLLTMLTAGVYGVVRDWDNNADGLEQSLDETIAVLQLERALQGAFAHSFRNPDTLAQEVFFAGDTNTLAWVSTVSPQRSGGLTAWRLYSRPGQGVYLQLAPALTDNPEQRLEDTEPRLLLENYSVEFSYLFEDTEFNRRWRDTWEGGEILALPLAVHIRMRPDSGARLGEDIDVIAPIHAWQHRSIQAAMEFLQ